MGTSFVELKEHGFWMKDSILELWLRLLSLHLEEPSEKDMKIRFIRDQWLLASRGYFTGCVPLNLEKDVSTEEGKKIVVNAIKSLLNALRCSSDSLDKNVLNLLGIESSFTHNIETWRLIEVGEAFLDLINGKIRSPAKSTEFMPGCKERRNS